jgi:hypothetical protein
MGRAVKMLLFSKEFGALMSSEPFPGSRKLDADDPYQVPGEPCDLWWIAESMTEESARAVADAFRETLVVGA